MKFPNAYKGVSKLLLAQILMIIGIIATLIGFIVMMIGANAGNQVLAGGGAIVTGGAVIAVAVLSIIAFIVTLIGLNQGRKDESNFMTAFIITIIALVISIISSFITGANPWLAGWMEFVAQILRLCAIEYVIIACMSLAQKLGDRGMADFGAKMRILITILWILMLVVYIFRNNMSDVYAAVSIGTSALELVVNIVYILFLSKAKKMLA